LPLINQRTYWNSFKIEPAWTIKIKDGKKFGIINIGVLRDNQIQTMFNELWDTDALVFDIRAYPNITIEYFIKYLFPGPIMIAKFANPDVTYPGTIFYRDGDTVGTGDFTKIYNKRIYILFNEDAQSASEYDIMALEQHPMAVKIGSQTAGADGNVSDFYLPGKIRAWFTGLGTFYPDYRPTQRVGIIPDINVVPTIQGIREGKDEVLEVAFNHYFSITSAAQEKIIPSDYSLSQNFPNPFNPTTTIKYSIPVETGHAPSLRHVTLKVYDLLGRDVATLVNEEKSAGSYAVELNAAKLSSGVYFYKLIADKFIQTKKMILLK
jgi:hypothetical protein